MDRKELESVGKLLFGLKSNGYGWQAEMARQLDETPVRTISEWGKKNPVPRPVAALLRMLAEERSR